MSESQLGAIHLGHDRCRFLVWAPRASTVDLHLVSPTDRVAPMRPASGGYFEVMLDGVPPGSRYTYVLDGSNEQPDPASRSQPEGVHGASAVVDPAAYAWTDQSWFGLPLRDYVIYELHVGTFTPEGTFDAIIPRLDMLVDLGVTALEVMPVAQFPGARNWGYDGVFPFAAQDSYGGAGGLHRLVDACHRKGLAVVLDVVYNHLGPEGNVLGNFGPYFTDTYHTPWGDAVNFDGPGSDDVRRYCIENARYWLRDLHVDALRLDAVHAIYDRSARPFLAELADAVHDLGEQLNRRRYLIAESDLNDPRLIRPDELGGDALDAQWNDDFHHALDALLTGERSLYHADFHGIDDLGHAFRRAYVYVGQYSARRERRHGAPTTGCRPEQFVVFIQNHDQVGNRVEGERLASLVPFHDLTLAAATTLLSPFIPLLFMGEEYGETRPFQYFTSHGDPELVAAVRAGRQAEFARLWDREAPDPQDPTTFTGSKLQLDLRHEGHHAVLWAFHRALVALRRDMPRATSFEAPGYEVDVFLDQHVLAVRRGVGENQALVCLSFADSETEIVVPDAAGRWRKRLDSAEARWLGPGSPAPPVLDSAGAVAMGLAPRSCVVYVRERPDDGTPA